MPYGMEQILDSVRKIVNKWVNTQTPITEDINPGDSVITVLNNHRFLEQDEIMVRDPITGKAETPLIVSSLNGLTQIVLAEPAKFHWITTNNCIIQKTFNQRLLQNIYLGDPENIPATGYPAVIVKGTTLNSEWLTLKSTKEDYKIDLTVLVTASSQESGYRTLINMADTIVYGLKRNLYPLIGPYQVLSITSNLGANDLFVKVSDVSWFQAHGNELQRVIIEDEEHQVELWVSDVIDDETLQLQVAPGCDFLVADNPMLIIDSRFIYNSWPSNVTYGEIYKGTLLKAAKISWFGWEEKIQTQGPRETYLH